MNRPRGTFTLFLFSVTLLVLLLSVPGSLRDALQRGNFYIFTTEFFTDIPRRLTGPGRFRFILQPLIATILGIKGGRSDARMGRPPYLSGLLFNRKLRSELLSSSLGSIVNLLLMGVLLDSIAQWLILGASYPGAALIVGPVLVAGPYSIARALANRCTRVKDGIVHE